MRHHSWFAAFELHHDVRRLNAIVAPETLAIARVEPLLSMRRLAALDLTFERKGSFAVLPFALVEGVMLLTRERDPIMWPRWVHGALDHAMLDAIADRVYPWLRSLSLARFANDEALRVFRDEPAIHASLERARDAGFMGVAPLESLSRSIAPAIYAMRFATESRLLVGDPDGANGAALLAGRAASVDVELGSSERYTLARRWFSTLDFENAIGDDRSYDVVVGVRELAGTAPITVFLGEPQGSERRVEVARALALSVFCSFEPEDSVPDATLAVAATPARPARAWALTTPQSLGGSTGRVMIVARDDWSVNPDADTDAIRALADRLGGEGFTVTMQGVMHPLEPADADIVHIFGHRAIAAMHDAIARLRFARVPVVVTPALDDPRGEGAWGAAMTSAALRNSNDAISLAYYFEAIERRRLTANDVPAPSGPAVLDERTQAAMGMADAAIVASDAEETLLRERYGYRAAVVEVPALLRLTEPSDTQALTGFDDFILVHASIEARSGILVAILAADVRKLPLVVVGSIGDSEYYSACCDSFTDRTIYLPERLLSEGDIAGLYLRARVFADPSWSGYGMHRLAKAGAAGCALVASTSSVAASVWGDLVEIGDPGSVPAFATALWRAWEAAPIRGKTIADRTAAKCDQSAALSGVANAYQAASHPAIP